MSDTTVDRVFEGPTPATGSFRFDDDVAAAFDDMARRSIPGYEQTLARAAAHVAALHTGATVHDLGTSTGALIERIAPHIRAARLRVVAVDLAEPMLARARRRARHHHVEHAITWVAAAVQDLTFEPTSFVFAGWLLQFVPVNKRLTVLRRLRSALLPGGTLLLAEKIRAADADEQPRLDHDYDAFKRANGYSDDEIRHKRQALDGVLVPLTVDDNVALLHEAGFTDVTVVASDLCFVTIEARVPDPVGASPALLERLASEQQRVLRDARVQDVRGFTDTQPPGAGRRLCVVDDVVTVTAPEASPTPPGPLAHHLAPTPRALLEALKPWRKGPVQIDGVDIDAEWRSELKWHRVAPLIGPLDGAVVADVGCNNGYTMVRLRELGARHVVGFDPQALYLAQLTLLRELGGAHDLHAWPLGVDDLALTPAAFDLILLMGVLYHVTDPISALRACARALRPGGRLLLETIVIDGPDGWCLTPTARYAGARGFWSLPTLGALETWCRRSGLRVVERTEPTPTTPDEQRSTSWRDGDSLAEGLCADDSTRTIEGYPAPQRVAWLLTRS